jgi:hypothetical protein
LDDEKRVIYVAAVLINRRVYRGKDEIEKAKEYIENHWLEGLTPTKRQSGVPQQGPFHKAVQEAYRCNTA